MKSYQIQHIVNQIQFFEDAAKFHTEPNAKWALEMAASAYRHTAFMLDIEILPLVETTEYLIQVAEECSHDCEPDHEERDHMEEMEYRSMQMG